MKWIISFGDMVRAYVALTSKEMEWNGKAKI
jgi:hypothetical protein